MGSESMLQTPRSMPERARAETTPRVLLPWSHYPSVCGRWFGSYPPRRTRSNSIAAFVEVWRITCRVTILGAAPTTDLLGRSGELPLMCGFTPTPPGLRPSDASIANLAGGLSYLLVTPDTSLHFGADLNSALFPGAANLRRCVCPVVVAAFWAAKCHTPSAFHLPATQRSLKTASASLRPPPLALRSCPCPQDSDLCASLGHAGSQVGSSWGRHHPLLSSGRCSPFPGIRAAVVSTIPASP